MARNCSRSDRSIRASNPPTRSRPSPPSARRTKSRHWQNAGEDALFALKSDLLRVLEEMNVPVASLQLVQGQNAAHWHPGRSARLQLGPKTIIAEFGELHPGRAESARSRRPICRLRGPYR
ncbi:MAG: hypothetical protein WDN06_20915 [Asticcacaulis sp.]